MYTDIIWLNCTTRNDELHVDGVHVQLNVLGTFDGHGIGGGDTPADCHFPEHEKKSQKIQPWKGFGRKRGATSELVAAYVRMFGIHFPTFHALPCPTLRSSVAYHTLAGPTFLGAPLVFATEATPACCLMSALGILDCRFSLFHLAF